MIYLHPASSCSLERIQAVQAATGLTAILRDGQVLLQPQRDPSGASAPSLTAPGLPVRARTQTSQISPADRDTGAVGVLCTGSTVCRGRRDAQERRYTEEDTHAE